MSKLTLGRFNLNSNERGSTLHKGLLLSEAKDMGYKGLDNATKEELNELVNGFYQYDEQYDEFYKKIKQNIKDRAKNKIKKEKKNDGNISIEKEKEEEKKTLQMKVNKNNDGSISIEKYYI